MHKDTFGIYKNGGMLNIPPFFEKSFVDYIFYEKYTTITSERKQKKRRQEALTNRKNMLNNIYSL